MRSLGALIRRLTEQNADHVFLDLPGRVAKTLVRLAGDSGAVRALRIGGRGRREAFFFQW